MPAQTAQQLTLPLFEEPSFGDLLSSAGMPNISIALSSRLKRGWYAKMNQHTGHCTLHIPLFLQHSPRPIKDALIQWAQVAAISNSRRIQDSKRLRKKLERLVIEYIHANQLAPQCRRPVNPDQFDLKTQGSRYDLKEVFGKLNTAFFQGKMHSLLRWGGFASLTSYQSMKKDQHGNSFSLITIAGVYDHASVPQFAIEGVMYHEMLHVLLPPGQKSGRRIIHSREFLRQEKKFPLFRQWRIWERTHVRKLAREMKSRHRLPLMKRLKGIFG